MRPEKRWRIIRMVTSCGLSHNSVLQPARSEPTLLVSASHPARLLSGCTASRASARTFLKTSFNKAAKSARTPLRGMTVHATDAKTVLVPIAHGSEEIEAVTIIDILRRAGARVTVASVENDTKVEMSRQVVILADKQIEELKGQTFDIIALPGGMPGAERLRDSQTLTELLEQQQAANRYYSAICAAPAVVLESKGLLKGKKATSHPGFSDELSDQSNVQTRVVVDGKVITSRGPGTSIEFALSLVHQLFGKEKADEIAKPLVITDGLVY